MPFVTASTNALGGITVTDISGGGGSFIIEDFNGSFAATNLNIAVNTAGTFVSGTALTFVGEQVEGIFTTLINIRDALQSNNVQALSAAGLLLDRVQENVLGARAELGSRISNLELAANRLIFERGELERFRSETRDVDLAEAATRFQIQQTVLQASLAVTARLLQTSIFNFL